MEIYEQVPTQQELLDGVITTYVTWVTESASW